MNNTPKWEDTTPSWDETSPAEAPSVSSLEALARGAESGATLGFAPRVNALLSSIANNSSYDKELKDSQEKFKQAEEEHPYLSTAGNLVGGVAPAMASGPLGLAGKGLGAAIKGGAVLGGIQGLGNSEDLTSLDALKHAGIGAAFGSGVGASLHGLGSGIKAIGNLNSIASPAEAFKLGFGNPEGVINKAGTSILGREGTQAANELALNTLGESRSGQEGNVIKTLQDELSNYGEQKSPLLQQTFTKEDYMPWVKDAQDVINKAKSSLPLSNDSLDMIQGLFNKNFFNEGAEGALTPKESLTGKQLDIFRKALGKYGSAKNAQGLTDSEAEEVVNLLTSKLEGGGSKRAAALGISLPEGFQPLQSYLEEKIPGVGEINNKLSALKSAEGLLPSLSQVISSNKTSGGGVSAQDAIGQFIGALKQDKDLSNEFVPQLQEQLSHVGKVYDLVHHANLPGLSHGWLADTARGGIIKTANVAGMGTRWLYNQTPEVLTSFAQKLIGSGDKVSKQLGGLLNEANQRDRIGRNALLFAVQQNPEYRSLLDSMVVNG